MIHAATLLRRRRAACAALAAAAALLALPAPAHASTSGQRQDSNSSARAGNAAKPGNNKATGKARFLKGSEESRSERANRLRRECKGRPNAGACLGHAS